jgi:osmotically-inducible protein OsmY
MKLACSILVCSCLASGLALGQEPSDTTLSAAARAKTSTSCRPGDSGFFRDQGLGMKLASKLKFRKQLLSEQIDARVSNGIATLSGGVSSRRQITLALNIASDVEGIHCINNFLRVGPPTPAQAPVH